MQNKFFLNGHPLPFLFSFFSATIFAEKLKTSAGIEHGLLDYKASTKTTIEKICIILKGQKWKNNLAISSHYDS